MEDTNITKIKAPLPPSGVENTAVVQVNIFKALNQGIADEMNKEFQQTKEEKDDG